MDKLNHVLGSLPPGAVATTKWLSTQGVSRQLASRYTRSRWLEPLGHGAYVRAGQRPDWTGALYAIQTQLGRPVHVGGKTALKMQGYSHFVPLGTLGTVWLFGPRKTRLPRWFSNCDWGVHVKFVATNLFQHDQRQVAAHLQPDEGLTEKSFGGWGTRGYGQGRYGHGYSIRLSAPERAMLELCSRVPRDEPFDEALLLMEGLAGLRASLVRSLLLACTSVKAKRVFMHLAETCAHRWTAHVDLNGVDFGRGKRSLAKGGRLDPKYRITVPVRTYEG